jgi:uncharacterized protein (TIRG00374 family)
MNTSRKSPVSAFITTITGWRGLLLILGLALAWHVLEDMPWGEAWGSLVGIGPYALLILLVLNLVMLPLMTARWWQISRTLGSPVGIIPLCAYRCAANAINYLSPGPHFGGEPLSVYLLHKQQGITLTSATTSVILDRLLELLASVVVLIIGFVMLTATDSSPFILGWTLPLVIALLAVLITFLIALFTSMHPLSRIIARCKNMLFGGDEKTSGTPGPWLANIIQGETLAASLARQHPRPFLLANLFSLGQWLGVFIDFWLMAAFMGHPLSLLQLTAVVMASRLAFLTPLPAGLGVLEATLPWLTAVLGLGGSLGLSLCMLIRLRDILFSVAGLGLAMKYLTCPGKASTVCR